jgi:hypothetical protein
VLAGHQAAAIVYQTPAIELWASVRTMAGQLHLPSREFSSVYKVTRELKKEQNSLFNCINSILEDAAFVKEIALLYPAVPLLANLRCGLWYTPKPDATCYFKSTDGHNGNWSFSTTRLNWHVAELAARQGGCIIVDATRKGKRFPVSHTHHACLPILACMTPGMHFAGNLRCLHHAARDV